MNKLPVTKKELICAVISVILLLILFPIAEWIRLNFHPSAYKVVAGYLLGTIGAFSYATMCGLYIRIRTDGLAAFDEKIWMRPFSVVFYGLIALFGLIAWVVSWEGKTGIPYGLGVLLGASLMEAGAGSIIKQGK